MSKYVDNIDWDDCAHLKPPHITNEELEDQLAGLTPAQRKTRKTGLPTLGAGAIYPVDIDELLIEPHPIPDFWHRAFALDVGWRMTAALFGAFNPETRSYVLYAEYYESQKEPVVHSAGIRSMMPQGWDLRGAIDPAAENSNQRDGAKLKSEYSDLGLKLKFANNAVEAGIHRCLMLMQTGRLKVFNTLTYFRKEIKLYRRNEKGRIVKERDHLMDDMRYLLNTPGIFKTRPAGSLPRIQSKGEW